MKNAAKLLPLLWLLAAGTAFAASTTAPKLERHTVTVDGHPIAVWSRSSAHPRHAILLVHGRTWSALPDFDLQVPGKHRSVMLDLSERGYAVYAVDLRGYGATPRNADGWSIPNQAANDVAQVLIWIATRHPHLRKPALLGWSMGSMVAHLTAQRYPQTLSDLILYGFPYDPEAHRQRPPEPADPPRVTNTRKNAASDFISPSVISQDVIDAYVKAALHADPVRADWKDLGDYEALDATKVHAPTLLIHGEHDPYAPEAAQSREFGALRTPDKQWVILPGADHAAMLEDTHDAFIAAVRAFIERPRAH